jgi:hypothetical protein
LLEKQKHAHFQATKGKIKNEEEEKKPRTCRLQYSPDRHGKIK